MSARTVQLVRLDIGGQPRWVVRTADSDSLLAELQRSLTAGVEARR